MQSAKKVFCLSIVSASTVLIGCGNIFLTALAETPASAAKPATKTAVPEKSEKKESEKKEAAKAPEPTYDNAVTISPDELVKRPHDFMNKTVKFTGLFSGFSQLALDYPKDHPMRPQKSYLSLLILTPNTPAGTKIPLSELKLAMVMPKEKDPETELLGKLKEGDTVEIIGKEFSTALDDPWVDVLRLKKIGGSKDDDKKISAGESDKSKSDKSKSDDKPGAAGKSE